MKSINGKKMKKLQEKKQARVIDVDSEIDFQKVHLKGAINIPHNEENFVQKCEKKFTKKNEEVILCGQNQLGTQLNRLSSDLERAGYKNVYQYKAGPSDWKASGLSFQRNA